MAVWFPAPDCSPGLSGKESTSHVRECNGLFQLEKRGVEERTFVLDHANYTGGVQSQPWTQAASLNQPSLHCFILGKHIHVFILLSGQDVSISESREGSTAFGLSGNSGVISPHGRFLRALQDVGHCHLFLVYFLSCPQHDWCLGSWGAVG